MACSLPTNIKSAIGSTLKLGEASLSADAHLVFDFQPELTWLITKFPQPVTTTKGEIEVPTSLGSNYFMKQQAMTAQQGAITMRETRLGVVNKFMFDSFVQANGTEYMSAWLYEGTPSKYLSAKRLERLFIKFDQPDRDWASPAQILEITGTVFFHYYGETKAGNSTDFR